MITLDEAKEHLRVDGVDENTYIQALIDAAQEYIQSLLTPQNDEEGNAGTPPAVNETQKMACKLIIAHWYNQREAVAAGGMTEVPMAFRMLLQVNRPTGGLF